MGNLTRIDDYKSGSPQGQIFGYDNLYRLTSAHAWGGTGTGPESYNYDPYTGNLSSKSTVGSYSYGTRSSGCLEGALAARPHAVTTAGTTTYCYDRNGNINSPRPTPGRRSTTSSTTPKTR